jgi:hypothetical protein
MNKNSLIENRALNVIFSDCSPNWGGQQYRSGPPAGKRIKTRVRIASFRGAYPSRVWFPAARRKIVSAGRQPEHARQWGATTRSPIGSGRVVGGGRAGKESAVNAGDHRGRVLFDVRFQRAYRRPIRPPDFPHGLSPQRGGAGIRAQVLARRFRRHESAKPALGGLC